MYPGFKLAAVKLELVVMPFAVSVPPVLKEAPVTPNELVKPLLVIIPTTVRLAPVRSPDALNELARTRLVTVAESATRPPPTKVVRPPWDDYRGAVVTRRSTPSAPVWP